MAEDYEDKASTYRIFSRLFCNFIIPDRPIPLRKKKGEEDKDIEEGDTDIVSALKQGKKVESKQDVEDEREGEIEGDEVLQDIGGTTYMERLQNKLKDMETHSNNFFTPEALEIYSPKFLHILENIQDPEYKGLHLVYSQFRTAEGIGLFTLVLNKNGFTQFKIKKIHLAYGKLLFLKLIKENQLMLYILELKQLKKKKLLEKFITVNGMIFQTVLVLF